MPAALPRRLPTEPDENPAAASEFPPQPFDAIRYSAAVLRNDPDPRAQAVAAWLADSARGDLLVFLAETDTRGEWLSVARDRRNRALRAAASLRYRDLRLGEASRLLAKALRLYRGNGGWSHTEPPPAGTFRGYLYEALAALDRDLSPKQLMRILGQQPG